MKTKDIKSTEKKTSSLDKVKALKEKIIANANALADRILNKAIAKEEQQKAWETRKEELKAEAAKKRKEAALKKREEKAKKLIQIHTSIPTKDTSKKQKAIDEEIEKKHDEKMIAMKTKFEDFDPKRQKLTKEERIERNRKRAIKLVHHKEIKDKIKHTTKEEREKAAAEARKAAYLAYKAEMQRQASEIAADPKAYQARQEKRKKSEQERLNMLAEKRKARMDKLQQVELTQKQKILKDLEHFKLAQERRNEKKLQRRQMYLSKGGIQLPKVKNKVEVRPIIEQPKKQDSSKHRYIVRTQYIDQPSLTGDRVGAIVCLPDKLKDIVKYSFNKMMEKESDKVVGYFIYDSDNPEVCIMEMVNSKYREIDGVTITRLQKQNKTAA
jgi:colicin import membrane protein